MSHDLPIERIMQTGLLSCGPDTPLCEAAARMAARRCSSILVMQGERALGIWTEHDVFRVDFADPAAVRVPIGEVMSTPVASLHRTTPVAEAAARLHAEGRRHFLVVGDADEVLGIITQTDLALNQGIEPYLRLREVRCAMRARPLVLPAGLLLAEAARRMRRSGDEAAVVAGDDTGELGIVTERDLVRFIADHPGNTPIGALASRPLLTVGEQEMLIHARDRLIDNQMRHLAVLDEAGRVVGLVGFRDMLAGAENLYLEDLREALEQRDRALSQSRQHLQLAERVIEASLEGIIITDARSRIEFVNPAFTRLTGYSLEEVVGRTPALLSSGRHDADFYHAMWQELQAHGYWRGEIWNRRKSGQLFLEQLTITAITDDQGVTNHYAALFTDITQLRENEERVRRLAYYDALTGLPNRRLLEDRLELAIRHAHRQEQRLAVIFIDLDHFKQVNDTLGHAVGDELLVKVAERLAHRLREDDTLARLGGDEFIVMLPELDEPDEVTRVARRLVEGISEPFTLGGHEFRIGCSLGISLYPDDGDSPEPLVRNADAAMYRAKQEGRNTYRLYHAGMHVQHHQQLALETALRNTVESGEGLEVHYQPLVTHDAGGLHSAEALLRWTHPEFGVVTPGEFIPLAERSGLIVPLGEWVMARVCRQLAEWRRAGFSPAPVAINLAAQQFVQPDLVERVQAQLAAHDLPGHLLGFELTESTLVERPDQARETLQGLSDIPCHVAIDDFGTGYSSLSYLHELPVSILKIDRSFIQGLGATRHSGAIVAAVSGMARELGLSVVAEGVETEAQHRALGRYGVDLIQGYLIGRPVDADEFARQWLPAVATGPA
ncbi:EAL domain-containing protein [Halomonas sp. C05BenzN]|uniref:EAL domain-containing protein n=1 Tax=Halomonas sp. C05BenzN TaxID=3411041 RepID=UPI003B92C8CC